MERKNAWEAYTQQDLVKLESLCKEYRKYLDDGKTERECTAETIMIAKQNGYRDLQEVIAAGEVLKAGDKVYAVNMSKAIALFRIGEKPIEEGMRILGAHIDSPRLDLKQNPLYEDSQMAYLDTHYYGGVKKYQWVAIPLAMHGVVAKKDGSVVEVCIGEDEQDPILCITDLLIHLSGDQLEKKGRVVVEGESLDVLVGSRPEAEADEEDSDVDETESADVEYAACEGKTAESVDVEYAISEDKTSKSADKCGIAEKDTAKKKRTAAAGIRRILKEKYGIEEEDFLSAEFEIVPADKARDCGLDRSMIAAYGQDDRVCAYTSLAAMMNVETSAYTACTLLVDKEEIGSVGATGMQSRFFENTVAEIIALTEGGFNELKLRRALSRSKMLSSDVSAAFDPLYAGVFDKHNCAFLGKGLVFNKYTGVRGKGSSNDANAEYIGWLRRVMDDAGVQFQTAELGKVDAGGGGTIAYITALYGMEVIDSGVAVLSMHAPMEVTSKADIYEAEKGYEAFLLG